VADFNCKRNKGVNFLAIKRDFVRFPNLSCRHLNMEQCEGKPDKNSFSASIKKHCLVRVSNGLEGNTTELYYRQRALTWRKWRWVRHAARIGEKRNTEFCGENLHLEDRGEITLRWISNMLWWKWLRIVFPGGLCSCYKRVRSRLGSFSWHYWRNITRW
jgi:hypothetical protein